jgi:hypothetical protein
MKSHTTAIIEERKQGNCDPCGNDRPPSTHKRTTHVNVVKHCKFVA